MLASSGLPIRRPISAISVFAFRRFDEDDVGAGLGIGNATPDRLVQALPVRASVRAMMRKSELERLSDATRILRTMSAIGITRRFGVWPHFFGKLLILDLDRGDAGLLVAAHRVTDIEQSAIAGIGIGDDRRLRHFSDAPDAVDHLRIGGKARVRQAQC